MAAASLREALEAAVGSVSVLSGQRVPHLEGASTFLDEVEQLQAWSIGIVENKRCCSNYSGVRT